MNFTIIGAGKVGTTIALLLKDYFVFDHFISRTKKNRYEELVGKEILTNYVIINSDIIFLTVPDDKIKEVAQNLKIEGNPLIIHFSGALPASEISLNYDLLSVHPMMSIIYPEIAKDKIKEHFITIEGKKEAVERFKPFIKYFTNNYMYVNKDEKVAFHLAAVLTNNFPTILISIATKILKDLPKEKALSIILPLLNDSFENLNYKRELSLTGPLVRKDEKTIQKHLSIIKDDKITDIYNSFSDYFKDNIE